MMQELAMSNQHIASVDEANLMPQQKAYDTKGKMEYSEMISNDGRDTKGMFLSLVMVKVLVKIISLTQIKI